MRYCVLGNDGVAGGYVVEMHLLMEQWCRQHCLGGYHVIDHGEFRFERDEDAQAFSRAWFMPDKWVKRPTHAKCRPGKPCATVDYCCPHAKAPDQSSSLGATGNL